MDRDRLLCGLCVVWFFIGALLKALFEH